MKILIISEYIAPVQVVASIRWTKIAKYLKKHHPEIEISVLTNQKDFIAKGDSINFQHKDELLEKEMSCFDKYIVAPYTFPIKIYYWLKKRGGQEKAKKINAQRKTIQEKISATNQLKIIFLELVYDFKSRLSFWQIKKCLKDKKTDYDVIISSYGPIWTHLAGEELKRKNKNMIWIADFRDPYAWQVNDPLIYWMHKRCTMKHCANADYVTRVNDQLEIFTPSCIPIWTITNGYDPQESLPPMCPKKFFIVYTGVMHGDQQDIGIACKAVLDLCQENKIQRYDIEISYAGPHGDIAKRLAEKYQAADLLRNYGMVPRIEALKMQQRSAILLQLGCNTLSSHCLWTGKAYEYMMAQKPIIYVVTGDVPYSEPSKYIDRLGGYCYEQCRHEETYQGMKDYILEKYQEWKATGNVTVQQDKDYVEQFAYPHIAEQVWQLIQEGMRKRNESGTVKEN